MAEFLYKEDKPYRTYEIILEKDETGITVPGCFRIVGSRAGQTIFYVRQCNVAIDSLGFENGVEIIEKGTFKGCRTIENVFFPETLKKIGDDAFSFCHIKKLIFWVKDGFLTVFYSFFVYYTTIKNFLKNFRIFS